MEEWESTIDLNLIGRGSEMGLRRSYSSQHVKLSWSLAEDVV